MSKLQIANNHLLLYIQTNLGVKTCVVDTGSPVTFFYDDNVKEYMIEGNTHKTSILGGIARLAVPVREDIEKLVGTTIGGFIGSDLMQQYGDIFIDLRNESICFGPSEMSKTNAIPMKSFMGLPLFNVSFNGHKTLTAFDSGAMYSFVSSSFAQNIALAPAYNTKRDYHPGHGWFDINLHRGDIMVGKTNLGLHTIATSDLYDNVLEMMGVRAFVGIDSLCNSTILLSYARNEISIE